jgi:predicted nucleotide-binding protein
MAKTKQPERRQARLSREQMKAALPKIKRRIPEVEALLPEKITDLGDVRINALESKLDTFVADVFGADTVEYERYVGDFKHISAGIWYSDKPAEEIADDYRKGLETVKAQLEAIQSGFEEELGDNNDDQQIAPVQTPIQAKVITNKVFIVHGHDDGLKETIARFLMKLSLEPVILHEQANEGKTLIEKFEKHSESAAYAIVLLTPDDIGGPAKGGDNSPQQKRARQNVILELGYFFAALKRKNVCALYMEGVELPSDINGLLYILLDARERWKYDLAREMKAAGLNIDMNNI